MRKNRIFRNDQPLKTIENNPVMTASSKMSIESNLKSNINHSILDNLLLNNLTNNQNKQTNYGQVIRLAYISTNNQVHIDEQALYILQRFTSAEIAFVGIYGQRDSGKSLLFDKILNLAGIQGSHYCRTSENYQKGFYFYSLPFIKNKNLNVFLLDCVGFQLGSQIQSKRQQDVLLDLMMILCSSVIFLPSVDDPKGQIYKNFYDRISDSMERITESKLSTTPDKQYWPRNAYCLLRSKETMTSNYGHLRKLFINCTPWLIYDALPEQLKLNGVSHQDLVEIQALPQKNMQGLYINGLYVKQASRLMRQVMQKVYTKNYCELKYNGNIVCKLLLTLIRHLNKKERIKIDKIFTSILKQLYQAAYEYHTEFYDEKLQQFFMQDDAFPLDYLMIAFQSCRQSVMKSFNQLSINHKMHLQYEEMLQKYIDQKQQLILQINKKKTKFYLKNKLKQQIRFPQNLTHKDQIFQFIQSLEKLQNQLDHDRCSVFSSTLIDFANNLQRKYIEDAIQRQQIILQELNSKIKKKQNLLEKQKQQNMKNVMLNTQNQQKYKNLLKQNQSLQYKVKNTKKQIDIQKKFQKQFMANKQAAKQHAQRLLGFIRQLQEKSRDNQKVIDEINKEFDYNPTIEILNKRIQEKIRQQKQIDLGGGFDSQISRKNFKRVSQVRTKISGSNISGVKSPSTLK